MKTIVIIVLAIIFFQVGMPVLDFAASVVDAYKECVVAKIAEKIARSNCIIAKLQDELEEADPMAIGFSLEDGDDLDGQSGDDDD